MGQAFREKLHLNLENAIKAQSKLQLTIGEFTNVNSIPNVMSKMRNMTNPFPYMLLISRHMNTSPFLS